VRVRNYQFTAYFEFEVLRRRAYLRKAWCIRTVESPLRIERQPDGRFRFWASVPEFCGRYLGVITLDDQVTIPNAFPGRGFKP